jgi:prepilin-type N-terminal cleavage/methylation domain-containing protein
MKTRAFTLVEMIVVIGILGLLLALSIQSFSNFSRVEELAASATTLAEALRDARARTLASVAASQYGVKVDAHQFILFKGSSFSSSTPGNELYLFPYPVAASSSIWTFVFSRVTGNSSASGTIDLYLPGLPGSQDKTVLVQTTGLVSIQ